MLDKTIFLDIETSTITTDCGHKMQVTFITNIIEMDTFTGEILDSKFFRTLHETMEHLKIYEEGTICWSHNLDYELTHILRECQGNGLSGDMNVIYSEQGQEILFRDKNAPLQVILSDLPNITFRDSYALFNKSVNALGDVLGLPKLEYDYSKVRLPWDDLVPLDYDYVERDNVIVAMSLWEYMCKNNFKINEIPLTFTSEVRKRRLDYIKKDNEKANIKYGIDVEKSFTSYTAFMDLVNNYQGGLTTSCMEQTGKYIDNITTSGVMGTDIKSSYPNQMCTKKFPKFFGKKYYEGTNADEIFQANNFKAYYGMFIFKNIRLKNKKYLAHISSSMLARGGLNQTNIKRFNGKLIEGDEIQLYCNDIDMENINMTYEYDSVICNRIHATNKMEYLRREEVSFLLYWFGVKETTKDKHLKSVAKLIINSMYGIKVSMPIKSNYTIEDGIVKVSDYFEYNSDKQNELYSNYVDTINPFFGAIDMYSTGVYVTSYARNQLIQKANWLVDNNCHVVYSDTDSIKFCCDTKEQLDKIMAIIEEENKKKIESNKKLPRLKSYKKRNEIDEDTFNKICTLGIWEMEDEEPHKLFCTFGAKKYGYISFDNKVKTTIAGCSKINVPKVINNFAIKNNLPLEDAFKIIFSPGTTFDETASGRTTAKKEKREYIDFLEMKYKGEKIKQFGGIIIENTTYTLNMTKEDSNVIGFNLLNIETITVDIEGNLKYNVEE